jgi:uncharacterized protein (DUF302 family)
MKAIRNLLALIGLIAVVAAVYAGMKLSDYWGTVSQLDPDAVSLYRDMGRKLLETGSAADATVWKVPVKEGLSTDDVEQTVRIVANELNIKNVGELPLSQQVELETGKPQRFLKIYMFCNPQTAVNMVSYSDAYSAYLPCRISLVEDKQGKLWLYTLNMDLMIHGGIPLPDDLRDEALGIKRIIQEVIKRGAAGEW